MAVDAIRTEHGIAYLKGTAPATGGPSITLSFENSPVCQSFSGDAAIFYVVDVGESYSFLFQRHLKDDGISAEEMHQIGLQNLASLAIDRKVRVQPNQNIFAVLMGGDFEASLVLLDQLWDFQFRLFVPGEVAVAIPARDVLAFCDSSSDQGIHDLQQVISRVFSRGGNRLISDKIYLRRDGKFTQRPV